MLGTFTSEVGPAITWIAGAPSHHISMGSQLFSLPKSPGTVVHRPRIVAWSMCHVLNMPCICETNIATRCWISPPPQKKKSLCVACYWCEVWDVLPLPEQCVCVCVRSCADCSDQTDSAPHRCTVRRSQASICCFVTERIKSESLGKIMANPISTHTMANSVK